MKFRVSSALLVIVITGLAWPVLLGAPAASPDMEVRVWEEPTVIPTYLAGEPEKNPMFYFGRVSQGAEGRVYPYPLYDTLTGKKVDKTYRLVYLENEYIRIGVLPEIGGRIFEGLDKTNGYHFFYRQHVIKPALIGLIGAWISGGVEWNIPHHHRATTFIPVQYRIEEHEDGGKTVWVGELEVRQRMRWAVGYTLRPGRSYLEVSLRIVNRTPVVNTMLCFANVAVHTNENYQVIFPPSTQYVTHHHKRQFTTWPIATGQYGGWDFGEGTDASLMKNHISANSMFAWNYQDDFLAGYDHGAEAGTMSVANHHVVPGKKLWTWGNGPRGRMWDKILTDSDGPYIELMVGAYSDNQPDYSWLQPYEVKSFSMYWYPFRNIGGAKNANLDAAVNLEIGDDNVADVGFYATAVFPNAVVKVTLGDQVLHEETVAIDPAHPYTGKVTLPAGADPHDLRAALVYDGRELVGYTPIRLDKKPMPEPVKDPPAPSEIKTNEELYLTGLWIEQFHNASLEPDPYWEEALRRDPLDVRVNTAFGINRLKKARFVEAEKYLRQAMVRLNERYATPKDAEATYYLGVALKAQGRLDEAFDVLYKATWNFAWRAPAYYELAEISAGRESWLETLDLLDRSLQANSLNIRAINLKAAVLRKLGRNAEALELLDTAGHNTDPLDVRSMAERWLASGSQGAAARMVRTMSAFPATAEQTAAEMLRSGLWDDGAEVLGELIRHNPDSSPMVHYYMAYFEKRQGKDAAAAQQLKAAAAGSPDYVFPFEWEAIPVLEAAMKEAPEDARAPYYLGNLLFDWQPQEAVRLWTHSSELDPNFPIVHRNLAIAYSHQATGNSLEKAIAELEKAVSLPNPYSIHFYELDQLYEAAGVDPEKRLALLEKNQNTVQLRDDALSREIALKVVMGKYDEAIQLMTGREFEVWEGGSLSVAQFWVDAHLLRGRQRLEAGQAQAALEDFQAAATIPENLPSETRGGGVHEMETSYWEAMAYDALGNQGKARELWQDVSTRELPRRMRGGSSSGPSGSTVQLYYRARALQQLGQKKEAQALFKQLVDSGEKALRGEQSKIDFFCLVWRTAESAFPDRPGSLSRCARPGRAGEGCSGQEGTPGNVGGQP